MNLTVGSLFSGVGCFDLGFERAGWTPLWFCEIDPECRRVLQKHWPRATIYEDVREIDGSTVAVPDIIIGGFPCQDISMAGKRAGLVGGRSGLWWEFRRVLEEVRPCWVLVENVHGLLSSWSPVEPPPEPMDVGCHGDPDRIGEGAVWEVEETSDLDTILASLGELGYWWAYRVLDSQYFGLAQRRERVFIVGRSGNASRLAGKKPRKGTPRLRSLPAKVLLEPDCLPGNPAPGRGERADVAPSITPDAHAASGNRGGELLTVGAGCRLGADEAAAVGHVAVCATGDRTHTLTSEGADASEDGSGRGTPVIAFHMTQDPICGDVAPCLSKGSEHGQATVGVAYNIIGTAQQGKNHAYQTEVSGCLQHKRLCPTGNEAATVIAFQERGWEGGRALETQADLAYALTAPKGGGRAQERNLLTPDMVTRRLTPVECCRLQGLPDAHLEIDPPLSDSAKYRMIGNGGAVPVVQWIATRIKEVHR